jgi:hypothetical protein
VIRTTFLICALLALLSPASLRAQVVQIQPSDICSGATIVDFETGSTLLPTVPGMTYAFGGMTGEPDWFDGDAPGFHMSPFGGPFFGQQVMANLVSLTFSDLAVAFSPPVEAFGAYAGAIPSAPTLPSVLNVRAFDSHGTLVSSAIVAISQPGTPAAFYGLSYRPGIARVEWRGGNMGFFGIDNLTFGRSCAVTEGVPVPVDDRIMLLAATLMILIIAFQRYKGAFVP